MYDWKIYSSKSPTKILEELHSPDLNVDFGQVYVDMVVFLLLAMISFRWCAAPNTSHCIVECYALELDEDVFVSETIFTWIR